METITAILPIVLLVGLGAVALLASAREIPRDQALVIFRLGKFAGVQHTGRRILIPLVDQAVWVYLRPQTESLSNVVLLLHEREHATIDMEYTYRVVDPAASVIAVAHVVHAIRTLLQTTLQTLAANQTRDQVSNQRRQLEKELISRTRATFASWGIELQSVSLRNLE